MMDATQANALYSSIKQSAYTNLRVQRTLPALFAKNVPKRQTSQLSTEHVNQAIFQGYISGVCTIGINFTGGEVLGNSDDLFDILAYTKNLGIPYRLNTNS